MPYRAIWTRFSLQPIIDKATRQVHKEGQLTSFRFLARAGSFAGIALAGVVYAQAATFAVTYNTLPCDTSGCIAVPDAAQTAFSSVVATYGVLLTNNVTVNLEVQFGTTNLGQSDTQYDSATYTSWANALSATSTANPGNADMISAVASLPADTNPVTGDVNSKIQLTTANAKALGISETTSAATPDSTITFSTASSYEYNSTATAGAIDFANVAEHELDEVLGIGSSLAGDNSAVPSTLSAEDYFRYSASGVHSVTNDPSAAVYFSNDGGVTQLAQFNQSGAVGDTNDWSYGCTGGVAGPYAQDATTCAGVVAADPFAFGSPEQHVLNSLGWAQIQTAGDITPPVPEPATNGVMGIGIVALVLWFRRGKGFAART